MRIRLRCDKFSNRVIQLGAWTIMPAATTWPCYLYRFHLKGFHPVCQLSSALGRNSRILHISVESIRINWSLLLGLHESEALELFELRSVHALLAIIRTCRTMRNPRYNYRSTRRILLMWIHNQNECEARNPSVGRGGSSVAVFIRKDYFRMFSVLNSVP